ncbi:hypothetical protein MB27_08770 [Actinoplanes utahensis]|uniref:Uncharacterized protein n=1 Tax=Actinoplanes utahensis TaxID=1869 RepID=A0A0A6UP06_ACTUT|nr:hypothetical protein MB27_08770 [Actinoplanes utahensis]
MWGEVLAGSTDAFGVLFERHADAVYNHCFRRTASWAAAEDLTSVVFLEVWRHRPRVRLANDSVLPWLLGVANNAARAADRSSRRYRRMVARVRPPDAAPDFAEDLAGRLDDERAMRRLLRAVDRLAPADRAVLSLCVWSGLSYEEAAVALGVPVGTVRSRLSRARARLRALMPIRLAEAVAAEGKE